MADKKWESSNHSDDDVIRMQQDALRRVIDMQTQSKQTLDKFNTDHQSFPQPKTASMKSIPPPPKISIQADHLNNSPDYNVHIQNNYNNHSDTIDYIDEYEDNHSYSNDNCHVQKEYQPNNINGHTKSFDNRQASSGNKGYNQNSSAPTYGRQHSNHPPKNINSSNGGFLGNLFENLTNGNNNTGSGIKETVDNFIGNSRRDTPVGKIITALDLDAEKIMLIILILLILNDGGDYTLILALGYLLL